MSWFQKWLVTLCSLFMASAALAQQGAVSTVMYALDSQGGKHKVRAFAYKNDWNRNEVRLEAADIPRIAPGVNQLLGYGRDFDDDGKIETWFMWNSEQGFVRYTIPGNHYLGYDVIQTQLFRRYHTTILTKVNVLASNLLAYLSLAASRVVNSQINYFKEMLDFEEISVRLQRGQGMGLEKLNPAQLNRMRLLLYEGYRRAHDTLNRANKQEFLALLVADVALWLSGGVIVKYIGKGLTIAGTLITRTAAGAQIKAVLSAMLTRSMRFVAAAMTKVQRLAGAALTIAQQGALKTISSLGLRGALKNIGRGLIMRGRIARVGQAFLKVKRKVGTRWTFTAASMGAGMWGDLRAETIRKEESSRLVHIVANSSQMQNDLVACVMGGRQPKGTELEYQVAGVVNIKTQRMSVMNDQNIANIAVDIGTKLTVDNAKDSMDDLALEYLENIVTETRQPKLMLVGYVAVIANELTSGRVKRRISDQTPILCPIRAER